MKIAVVGSGYVGLVSGACFAALGYRVTCVDVDKKKIAMLNRGEVPIYEPGLKELIASARKKKRIDFTTDLAGAARSADIVVIAVGTPPKPDGDADLTHVENAARAVAQQIRSYKIVVEKSTVPVQTGHKVKETIERYAPKGASFDVASNPEFLREGTAIEDFMHPDRVVIGVESKKAEKILTELYKPLKCPIVVTDIKSAEIIKHASNSFLAMKISFINAVSQICDLARADVEQVAQGMGLDRRIGRSFLNAGIGFGGSCFPKDLAAFIRISEKLGYDFGLLKEVEKINEFQKKAFLKKVEDTIWNVNSKTFAVLGLAFKPDTDDMRCAPSVDILGHLKKHGASIRAYDPHATARAREILTGIQYCRDAYEACRGADCVLVLTEWKEFRELDLNRVKKLLREPIVIDGRNIYDPKKMTALGFRYISMGRASERRRGASR